MKVHIKGGKGTISLFDKDYLAEGGQGKVYAKGNIAYKIYHDSKKMIPEAKIMELSVITLPNIIKPEDILVNDKQEIVGYTMRYVSDTHPLVQTFTKAFKQRENLKEDMTLKMVQIMQKSLEHIHEKGILAVDFNEMNFLVSKKFDDVYFADVDSYQTKGFPATVLMESVRDRHMTKGKFTRETDWFSFGIVTFQMWTGIHPYKGTHPTLKSLDERMLANVWVGDSNVKVPAACYPISVIPKAYLEWYKAIFAKGLRIAPPKDLSGIIVVQVVKQKISGSNFFDIEEIHEVTGNIVNYYYSNGSEVIVTDKGTYLNGRESTLNAKNPAIGFTAIQNKPIAAYAHNGNVEIYDLTNEKVLNVSSGKTAMSYNNRIYVQNDAHINEVLPYEGKQLAISTQPVANILEKSTKMFEGVVIQNLLGSPFVSLFPISKNHKQINLKELKGYTVIDAKFENGVLMIAGVHSGKYDRLIFRFNENWEYDMRVVKDIVYSGLNFTVLDNGICVCITEEDKVEIFSSKKDSTGIKEVSDPGVDGSMRLFHKGTKVLFTRNNKLFSMTMRK